MLIFNTNKLIEINRNKFLNDTDYFNKILELKFKFKPPKQNNDNFLINMFLKKI